MLVSQAFWGKKTKFKMHSNNGDTRLSLGCQFAARGPAKVEKNLFGI